MKDCNYYDCCWLFGQPLFVNEFFLYIAAVRVQYLCVATFHVHYFLAYCYFSYTLS